MEKYHLLIRTMKKSSQRYSKAFNFWVTSLSFVYYWKFLERVSKQYFVIQRLRLQNRTSSSFSKTDLWVNIGFKFNEYINIIWDKLMLIQYPHRKRSTKQHNISQTIHWAYVKSSWFIHTLIKNLQTLSEFLATQWRYPALIH